MRPGGNLSSRSLIRQALLLPALLVLLCFRLVRPLVEFRIVVVGFHRFGHLALEPEMYLSQFRRSSSRRVVVNLWSFGNPSNQTNRFLASLWIRRVCVLPSWVIDALVRAGRICKPIACNRPSLSIHGPENGLDVSLPSLMLDTSHKLKGFRQLESMGVDPLRPYVCLIIRDSSHYASLGLLESPGYSVLNFDVETFHLTAAGLADAGFQVLRMGAGSERPLVLDHPGVVDYAKSPMRNEFLDVYIAATCSFAVSTQTGPDAVCLAFRRPVYYVDVTRFSQFFFGTRLATWNPTTIFENGKRLSLREIVRHDLFWLEDPDAFLRSGVVFQRSSPKDLARMALGYAAVVPSIDHRSDVVSELDREVHEILRAGMGERGQSIFGEPRALLNPVFLQENADWFLS